MLKYLPLFALAAAAPAAAQDLAGVSDQETTIAFAGGGGIVEYHKGNGDVLFVRSRANHWYRVQTNKGCLTGYHDAMPTLFDTGTGQRLDKLSVIRVPENGVTCAINSIRRSEAPPQVDSNSVVTLD
jgi:hypothetical protein